MVKGAKDLRKGKRDETYEGFTDELTGLAQNEYVGTYGWESLHHSPLEPVLEYM